MNIWLVNHYALPLQRSGGTRHYALAREWIHQGHQATLIASNVDYMRREEACLPPGEIARLESMGGVPFLWLRTPPYRGNSLRRLSNMLIFAHRVVREASRHLPSPDVVIGSTPHLFAAWAAYRLARRHRVPFVLEVRDLWPQTLIDVGGFSRYHPFILLLAALERFLYQRAHAVVTLLPGASAYIAHLRGTSQGIHWIPNGVDFNLLPPPVPPPPESPFVIMYAGAHGIANGLDIALEAARCLHEADWGNRIHFRFIGDGPEKPRLVQQAKRWGLHNVTFEAPVPKREVYSRLQQAHAFLMILRDSPLFRWGISPNKLFDFMAMARPVIFCVRTSYNPIEAQQAGVTVPPDNPQALAEAIRAMAQIPSQARWEMGRRGRAYVEQEHDLHKLALRFEKVLREASNVAL